MEPSSLETNELIDWVERIQSGDRKACDELIRKVQSRMERLVRKLLNRYPAVHRWEDTNDVLQNVLLRLLRALEQITPPRSVRQFYALANLQIRRELIDLIRRVKGPCGVGANHASWPNVNNSGSEPCPLDAVDRCNDAEELERWAAFHEEIEKLPDEEREVVSLVFYQGWTRAEIAALYEVDERTVRRWWRSACKHLMDTLKGEWPLVDD